MKKILLQSVIFILPFLFFLLPPIYILLKSGENFKNIDNIVLSNNKYLIGYAYHERNYGYLKYIKIKEQKYDIIALGTSRVLQFRDKMFISSFYNAGYTITDIEDFIPFLENIPLSKTPKYLIIGLDQPMFNESWNFTYSISNKDKWKNSFQRYPTFRTVTGVWKDIINRKYGVLFSSKGNDINYIGLNAIVNNKGFRYDGSIYYGDQIYKLIHDDSSAIDYHFSNTFDRINKGNQRFEYGDSVDLKAIVKVRELLNYCQNRDIKVIAFLPPYADAVFKTMDKSGKYQYLSEIYDYLKPVFDEFDFEIYDFSMASLCNSNDNEMIDGFHGGEVTYIKLLMEILKTNSVLSKIANLSQLEVDLQNKKNSFTVYE